MKHYTGSGGPAARDLPGVSKTLLSFSVSLCLCLPFSATDGLLPGCRQRSEHPAREYDLRVLHSLLLHICSKARCHIMQCPLINSKWRMDEPDYGEGENVQMLVAHNVLIWSSALAQHHHQRFVFGLFVLSQQ